MATVNQLKAILPADRFSGIDKSDNTFAITYRDRVFRMPDHAVDSYFEFQEQIERPEPTAIFYPGYYEHLVERIGSAPIRFGPPLLRNRITTLSRADNSIMAELSPLSGPFALTMLRDFDNTFGRLPGQFFGIFGQTDVQFDEFFRRFWTVKVTASDKFPHNFSAPALKEICEAVVFHLAYGRTALVSLSRTWDRGEYRLRRGRIQDVQFPRRTYNSDLISYYQLGLGSDSILLAYLAFYKILEHFFPSVAEKGLHKRMAEKMVTPEFSHTKATQLRQLASIVRKYDQRMQEEKMLAAVIEYFFEPDEIKEWVVNYQKSRGEYYTKPHVVLEEEHTLDLNQDQIGPSLAARIYHVRNALVHNKEGEVARFIPYSGQESVLLAEIPIVQFLAEQLIIRSGSDID